MEKKNIFYLIISCFLVMFVYILIGIYGYLDYKKFKKFLFKNSTDLQFHYKYSNIVNHLRAEKFDKKTTGYLFNSINEIRSENKILFLGDSWFDQIDLERYKNSKKSLIKFSNTNKIQIINGGIASFSPSLMHVQYNLLKKEFKIYPTNIVIHIDQTDIGDEYCRYKERKVYNDKKELVSIERFDFDKQIFNGLKIYRYSEIELNSKYVVKLFNIANFSIEYFLKKNFFRIKKIFENGWRTSDEINYYKCRFKVIKSFLIKKNYEADKYFKNTLIEFFDILNKNDGLKKIIITSFPHKGHLTKNYTNNVSTLIDDVIKDYSAKFYHLNFSEISYEDIKLDKLYVVGDEASHLTPEYHNKIFIKKIIEKIEN